MVVNSEKCAILESVPIINKLMETKLDDAVRSPGFLDNSEK